MSAPLFLTEEQPDVKDHMRLPALIEFCNFGKDHRRGLDREGALGEERENSRRRMDSGAFKEDYPELYIPSNTLSQYASPTSLFAGLTVAPKYM